MMMRLLSVFALAVAIGGAADAPVGAKAEVFGTAQVSAVYRLRVDKDAMLLETILDFIHKNDVQDGGVLTAAGSVAECTVHGVGGKMRNFRDPMEIDSLSGIIAAGEPHLHAVLSNDKGAVGGHLEKNCRVLSHVELTIVRFSGQALERQHSELMPKR